MRLLIKNVDVVNRLGSSGVHDIYIENGIICSVEKTIEIENVEVIDAHNHTCIPGLIDMYCDICDPGYENKDDILTITKSAAKGGFTSITCLPSTDPVIDNKTVVNYIHSTNKQFARVNIFPYGSMTIGCEGTQIAEIGQMVRSGIVGISDGGISVLDSEIMRSVFLYCKMFDIPIITKCDDSRISGQGMINLGRMSTLIGIEGIPREAEEIIVARNILLAKYSNSRLHITHVSTKGSVELIRLAKQTGLPITCDTCPHYFTLTENEAESYNTLAKVKPPLRTEEDRIAIVEGLLDDTIDVIASGHSPTTAESKNIDFSLASFGISSLETAFSLSYTALVDSKIMSLSKLVSKMAWMPAQILGLKNKGTIAEGMDADLIIFDKNKKFLINANEFASKAKYSLYDGQEVMGGILYTIVNGNTVFLS